MRGWTVPAVIVAITCVLLMAAIPASAQEAPQPLNSQDQYGDQIVRVNGLDELAELGINGPEDFDYCDAEGCHILGPSGKEFFFCDPNWRCEYSIWAPSDLSAEDFDYFESLYRAGSTTPDDGVYSEYGFSEYGYAYVCGSGEVCLNVSTYQCDLSGDCKYYTNRADGAAAGMGDIVPGAGRDGNRAYEAFKRALETSPASTKTALASESSVTGGAPPVSGGSSSGDQESGESGSEAGSSRRDSPEQASEGSGSDEENGAASDSDGNNSEGDGTNGDNDSNSEQGNAGAGSEGDADSAGSASSASDSSSSSPLNSGSVALGVGALALLGGGVILAVRLFRS